MNIGVNLQPGFMYSCENPELIHVTKDRFCSHTEIHAYAAKALENI